MNGDIKYVNNMRKGATYMVPSLPIIKLHYFPVIILLRKGAKFASNQCVQ